MAREMSIFAERKMKFFAIPRRMLHSSSYEMDSSVSERQVYEHWKVEESLHIMLLFFYHRLIPSFAQQRIGQSSSCRECEAIRRLAIFATNKFYVVFILFKLQIQP